MFGRETGGRSERFGGGTGGRNKRFGGATCDSGETFGGVTVGSNGRFGGATRGSSRTFGGATAGSNERFGGETGGGSRRFVEKSSGKRLCGRFDGGLNGRTCERRLSERSREERLRPTVIESVRCRTSERKTLSSFSRGRRVTNLALVSMPAKGTRFLS